MARNVVRPATTSVRTVALCFLSWNMRSSIGISPLSRMAAPPAAIVSIQYTTAM